MKKLFSLSIVVGILFFSQAMAEARLGFSLSHDRLEMTVGIIQRIERNTLVIKDERDHSMRRLISVTGHNDLQEGDYVRVYYHARNNLIETIKKMTTLEYKKENQNLGYIFKKDQK